MLNLRNICIVLGIVIAVAIGAMLLSHSTPEPSEAATVPADSPAPVDVIPTTHPTVRYAAPPMKNPFTQEPELANANTAAITITPPKRPRPTAKQRDAAQPFLDKAADELSQLKTLQAPLYFYLAQTYARCGDLPSLNNTIDSAAAHFRRGNFQPQLAGLRTLAGDVATALDEVDASPSRGVKIQGHICIAKALLESGDRKGFLAEMDRALAIASRNSSEMDVPVITLIAHTLAEAGETPLAMRAAARLRPIDELHNQGRNFREMVFYSIRAQHEVAIIRANANDILGAKSFLESDYSVSAAIAEAYCRLNNTDGGLRTAEFIGNPPYKHRAMLAVAAAFMRQNNIGAAQAAFKEARKINQSFAHGMEGIQEDADFAATLADCGDFQSASQFLESIPAGSIHQQALGRIALAYARRGDFDNATQTLESFTEPRAAISSLQDIALLQARANQLPAALQTIARLPEQEKSFKDPTSYPRFDSLIAAFKSAAKSSGDSAAANFIPDLPTPQERAAAYIGLAQGLCELP